MSESSDYTWYIDTCGDSRTNDCIAQMLTGTSDECECWEQLCEDGKRRALWRCPDHEFLSRFEHHMKRYKYRYAIYKKKGKYGEIRLWQFSRPATVLRKNKHQAVPEQKGHHLVTA